MKIIRRTNRHGIAGVIFTLAAAVLFALAASGAMPACAAEQEITVRGTAHMAGTSGNTAYYAVGIDGGGELYRYDASTRRSIRIAKGKWLWLNVKGKMLYLVRNRHIGSDGREFYIYSMKTNGKSKKKIAEGCCPVVKGRYIYYFALKKTTRYGSTTDDRMLGLYRMRLNGEGKKRLVAFPKNANAYVASDLSATDKGLFYRYKNKAYIYNTSTGKKSRYRGAVYSNIGSHDWYIGKTESAVSGLYSYMVAGKEMTIFRDGEERTDMIFDGEIHKVIASAHHVMVIVHEGEKYAVYMMGQDGTNKKRVRTGMLVSGGEDYR